MRWDHPRMCGEHLGRLGTGTKRDGIIPACAGSTRAARDIKTLGRDHPRMCGEHRRLLKGFYGHAGSSPHVRGALLRAELGLSVGGIIPACAGSTSWDAIISKQGRDHPRMCGEHERLRGMAASLRGSSPHVRGAPTGVVSQTQTLGIIPACAGSTPGHRPDQCQRRDHPRMCGEHVPPMACGALSAGSSPHVRGARRARLYRMLADGIIPACAGSTLEPASNSTPGRDHPRMCGEHTSKIA